jgi:hypothetical protein
MTLTLPSPAQLIARAARAIAREYAALDPPLPAAAELSCTSARVETGPAQRLRVRGEVVAPHATGFGKPS